MNWCRKIICSEFTGLLFITLSLNASRSEVNQYEQIASLWFKGMKQVNIYKLLITLLCLKDTYPAMRCYNRLQYSACLDLRFVCYITLPICPSIVELRNVLLSFAIPIQQLLLLLLYNRLFFIYATLEISLDLLPQLLNKCNNHVNKFTLII